MHDLRPARHRDNVDECLFEIHLFTDSFKPTNCEGTQQSEAIFAIIHLTQFHTTLKADTRSGRHRDLKKRARILKT